MGGKGLPHSPTPESRTDLQTKEISHGDDEKRHESAPPSGETDGLRFTGERILSHLPRPRASWELASLLSFAAAEETRNELFEKEEKEFLLESDILRTTLTHRGQIKDVELLTPVEELRPVAPTRGSNDGRSSAVEFRYSSRGASGDLDGLLTKQGPEHVRLHRAMQLTDHCNRMYLEQVQAGASIRMKLFAATLALGYGDVESCLTRNGCRSSIDGGYMLLVIYHRDRVQILGGAQALDILQFVPPASLAVHGPAGGGSDDEESRARRVRNERDRRLFKVVRNGRGGVLLFATAGGLRRQLCAQVCQPTVAKKEDFKRLRGAITRAIFEPGNCLVGGLSVKPPLYAVRQAWHGPGLMALGLGALARASPRLREWTYRIWDDQLDHFFRHNHVGVPAQKAFFQACDVMSQMTAGGSWPAEVLHQELLPDQPTKSELVAIGRCTRIPAHNSLGVVGDERKFLCQKSHGLIHPNGRDEDNRPAFALMTEKRDLILQVWPTLGEMAAEQLADSIIAATSTRRRCFPLPFSDQAGLLLSGKRGGDRVLAIQRSYAYRFRDVEGMTSTDLRNIMDREIEEIYGLQEKAMVRIEDIFGGVDEDTEEIQTNFDGVHISKINVRDGAAEEELEKAARLISEVEKGSRREFVKNLMLAAFEDLKPYYDHRGCRDLSCDRPDRHLAVYLEPQCFMREGKPRVIGRIWDSAMLFYRFCSNLCGSRFTCRMPGQEAATCADDPDWESLEAALESSKEDFGMGNFDASNSTGQMWRSLPIIAEKAHLALSECYPEEEDLLREVGDLFGSELHFEGIFELLLCPNRIGVIKEGRTPGLPLQLVNSQDYKGDERRLKAEEWNNLFGVLPTPFPDIKFRERYLVTREISPVDCSFSAKDGMSGVERGIQRILSEYKDDHIFRDLPCTQRMEEIMTSVFRSDVDTLVSAPTGTGKTSVIIAAIIRLNAGATVVFTPKILAAMELLARLMELFPPADGGPDVDPSMPMDHSTWERLSCDRKHDVVLGVRFQGSVDPDLSRCTCLVTVPFHTYLDAALGFPSTVFILDEPDQYRYETSLIHEEAFSRTDLSVVAMSATLDEEVSRWPESELIRVEQSEVNAKPREVTVPSSKWKSQLVSELDSREDESLGVLIFVLTRAGISRVADYINSVAQRFRLEIVPIHGVMSGPALRAAVTAPLADGKKARVYIATDIATTAVTLPNVTIVVDDGTRQQSIWEPLTTAETLDMRMSHRTTSTQRKGRSSRCRYPAGHRRAGALRPSVYIRVQGCEESGESSSELGLSTQRTLGVFPKDLQQELQGVHGQLSTTFHPLASSRKGGLMALGKSSSVLAKAAAKTIEVNSPFNPSLVPVWHTTMYRTLPILAGGVVPKMSGVHTAMFLEVAKFGQMVDPDPEAETIIESEYLMLLGELRSEASPILAFIALSHAQAWGETISQDHKRDKNVRKAAFMIAQGRVCGRRQDRNVDFAVLSAVFDKVDFSTMRNKRLIAAHRLYNRLFETMFRRADAARDGLTAEYISTDEVVCSQMYQDVSKAFIRYPSEILIQSPGIVDGQPSKKMSITSVWSGDRFVKLTSGYAADTERPTVLLGARPWKRDMDGNLRVSCYLPAYDETQVEDISELVKPAEPIFVSPGESKECFESKLMCPSHFRDHVLGRTDMKRVFEQFEDRLHDASQDLGDLYDSGPGHRLLPEEECEKPDLVNWLNLANPLTNRFLQANNSAARNMVPFISRHRSPREHLLPQKFRDALEVLRRHEHLYGVCGFASLGSGDDRTEVYPSGAEEVCRWSVCLGEFVGGPTSTVYGPFRQDGVPVGSSLLFTENIRVLDSDGVHLLPLEVIKPGTAARTHAASQSQSFPIDPASNQDLTPLRPWSDELKANEDHSDSSFIHGTTCTGGPRNTARNRAQRGLMHVAGTEHLAAHVRILNATTQIERRVV